MNLWFEPLRPNERVFWSGELEKRQRDAAIKPAPSLAEESKPRMRVRDEDHIVKAIRGEWGIKP